MDVNLELGSPGGVGDSADGTTADEVNLQLRTFGHHRQLAAPTSTASVRPRSLQIGPEKEPINFNVSLIGAPPEVEQLVEHIKSVAEQFLYRWKTFPLNLPTPVCGGNGLNTGGELAYQQHQQQQHHHQAHQHQQHHHHHTHQHHQQRNKQLQLNLADLFVAPMFDELDAVAMDGTGELKRLSSSQLKTLREQGLHNKDIKFGKQKKLSLQQLESIQLTGEFEVASLNFPGQVHRWQLSQLLQKGHQRAHDSLLDDLALAARMLIVTAGVRISGRFFSVAHAARALAHGLVSLLDMTVGVPSLLAHNLDHKLREERCRFLVAELVCRPEYERCMDTLCSYVRRELRRATTEKFDVDCDLAPPVPYLFLTPAGLDIDLRLFSRDLIRRALPVLIGILERETRGWFLHFRERLIAEMREKKMTDAEIEQEVNEAVMREYLQRVYGSIRASTELQALGDGVAELLVQQAQSVVIAHRAIERTQRELRRQRNEHERLLRNDYPVLSRVRPWLRDQLRQTAAATLAAGTWSAHDEAIRACTKSGLSQAAYFLGRDLAFMREREPVLLKELRNAKTPTRTFQWSCRIWSPHAWIIRRNFQGQSEQIPTVISQLATSIVTPRSDPSQPVFLVQRETVRTTSTRWPLWRLLNMVMRMWCWTWNLMFVLGVCVPWYSPLGVRALCGVQPFMPDLELSQVNGTLFPRKTSVTPTLASRLIELWRHISKSRSHFESKPDTGFIGRGLTRHANRMWNYVGKGLLGTLALVFVFPLVCIVTSAVCVLLALATPVWVPVATVLLHVYMLLVYDLDCPDATRKNRYCVLLHTLVWTLAVQGVVQPVAAVLVATTVCPVLAVLISLVGTIRYWLRLLWDSFTYHLFIKKCGRVPARDGLAVRRIAGPGLAADYYFAIRPEQALAAFEAKMELDELLAYQQHVERQIFQPQKDFSQFVEACFGTFSAQLSKSGAYRALDRESHDLQAALREKLQKRRQELQTGLTTSVLQKIKLDTMDLKIALQQGAHLLEKFYPEHVFGRLTITEDEFWDAKGLQINDWAGLAGHLYTDIFSHDFLTPLAETDTKFRLEPHPQLDLQRYTAMVQTASDLMGVNGPDLLGNVYAPRGNIQVHSPYLEIAAFNPRSKMTIGFRKADKKTETKTGLTTPRVHAKRLAAANLDHKDLDASIVGGGDGRSDTWRPWKRKHRHIVLPGEKLLIPLPIPHPAHIAIAVHNRDAEQPIQLDSEMCWDILRAIEDCQGDVKAANVVSRYRGGGGGGDGSSSSATVGTGSDDLDGRSLNGRPTTTVTVDVNAGSAKHGGSRRRGQVDASLDSVDNLSDSNDDAGSSGSGSGGSSRGSSGGASDSSGRTNDDSLAEAAGGTETLPCGVSSSVLASIGGGREVSQTRVRQTPPPDGHEQAASGHGGGGGGVGGAFHWTLSNWGASQASRRRAAAGVSGTVRVDLASPEDISLDTDSARAGFNAYGTTV